MKPSLLMLDRRRSYSEYGLADPDPLTTTTDLVRQLWLDNDFYGNIFSLQLNRGASRFTLGGGWTRYDGGHFGEVIWASNGIPTPTHRWYDNDAKKTDFNLYLKQHSRVGNGWNLFYDLQYRRITYTVNGFRDNPSLAVDVDYNFFNPKAGVSYMRNGWKAYASYGIASKEPNRDDFEAGLEQQPKREKLSDLELGVEHSTAKANFAANVYFMNYKDQLVLTGKINDVGAYTRTNIPESYRLGIEVQGGVELARWMNLAANLTLSQNKVKNFSEFMDDYDLGGQKAIEYKKTDLAFSPDVVGSASINLLPAKGFEISLLSKYVGRQYLDNTSNIARSLDAFFTQDVRFMYTISPKWLKEVRFIAQVNNLFGSEYEPNGYTFSYIYGGETITENYYFPMAGRNWVIGMNIRL